MDTMTQKLDRLNVNTMNSCTPSTTCDRCGSLDHVTVNCQVGDPLAPSPSELVAYVNNFQPRPNYYAYSITYNPGGSIIETSLIELSLYPFSRLMLDLHQLDFKDGESMLEGVLLAQQKQDEYIK